MSAMPFRNVEVPPGTPVDDWPAEAVETVLDRGSLRDWQQLSAAIRRSPWGPTARTVANIVTWGEHYGVDRLFDGIVREARQQVDREARQHHAAEIRRWREATGLSLRRFSRLVGTSASRLSDYERAKVAPTTDVLGRIEHVARTYGERRPTG